MIEHSHLVIGAWIHNGNGDEILVGLKCPCESWIRERSNMTIQDALLLWRAFLIGWMALGAIAAVTWAVDGLRKWIRRRR